MADKVEVEVSLGPKDAVSITATLTVNGVECTARLSGEGLSWGDDDQACQEKGVAQEIPIADIICTSESSKKSRNGAQDLSFQIHYMTRNLKTFLREKTITLGFKDADVYQKWFDHINDQIRLRPGRPHKLLVIVNPFSGGRTGKKIFEKQVAPLFAKAMIDTEVVVTERAGQAQEMLETYDLSSIDGIAVVGGDGTFRECVLGVISQVAKRDGIDLNDTNAVLPPIPIPLGVIPAGTGNGMAAVQNGKTSDAVNSTLSIIQGHEMRVSFFTAHQESSLIGGFIICVGYGFSSYIIQVAEEDARWMRRGRYAYAAFKGLFHRREFVAEIDYLPEDSSEWKKDTVTLIDAGCWPPYFVASSESDNTFPTGCNVMLVKPCTKMQHIGIFKSIVQQNIDSLQVDYLIKLKVKEFKLRVIEEKNNIQNVDSKGRDLRLRINIDGEKPKDLKDPPQFHIRCHDAYIRLYGARISPVETTGEKKEDS